MDRRQALAKLGAGGAAAVGLSLVKSSPAFAYDLATPNLVPVVNVSVSSPSAASVNVNSGTATCPGSANSTAALPVGRSVTISTVAVVSGELRVGNVPLPHTGSAENYLVEKYSSYPTSANYVDGDSFSIAVTDSFQCTYSDGTTTLLQYLWPARVAAFAAGSWTVT